MALQQLNSASGAFPDRLHNLHDTPQQIFIKGDLNLDLPLVAIIGSRRPTAYGKSVAYEFAYDLARNGIGIVSGLALGIDAIAHRAALDAGGYTIAVLANGLDAVYPARNTQLAKDILDNGGAIVSEYPPGTPSIPRNFLARNRIVAALSDGILVVEAMKRSGTASTARFGLDLGREVMAVPGSVKSVLSEGTNNLIKTGACMITDVDDVLFALNIEQKNESAISYKPNNKQEKTITDLIKKGVTSGKEMLEESNLSTADFQQTLGMLELEGVIKCAGNNTWFFR